MTATTSFTDTRTAWIDNVRVLATIAVIILHVSAFGVSIEYNQVHHATPVWWVLNFYESLSRCCVPLFVMLTGALLLPKPAPLGYFLKKRLSRIIFPFIFWSIVYLVFNVVVVVSHHGWQALHHLGHWFISQVVYGTAVHLWYVYMLIGLYLFIPVIQVWVISASNTAIIYFLLIWVLTLLIKQFHLLPQDAPFNLEYFSGYLGYLLLGYYLSARLVISNKIMYMALLLSVAGLAATFIGTYLLTHSEGQFSDNWYNYLTLNVALQSAGTFILIKTYAPSGQKGVIAYTRNVISRYGFGIYLCHLLVLTIIAHFNIEYRFITPIIGVPLSALVCLIGSYVLLYVVDKAPLGKYISGKI